MKLESYKEYTFLDVYTNAEFKVKDLTEAAQQIMYWFAEYDGTPERAIDLFTEDFTNDTEDAFTPENLSEYICNNKDKIANVFYDYNTDEDFENFNDLVTFVRKQRELEEK